MATALILAGAVAKGAFEAGVLSVVAREVNDISRIVATSAGALNGAVYAAGIRVGRTALAAGVLEELWRERARFTNVVRPSGSAILHGLGLSTLSALREVLDEALERVTRDVAPDATRAAIQIGLVTTLLEGKLVESSGREARTFEELLEFRDEDFDSERARARIREAALASAAFPFLYEPQELEGGHPCIDGGAVNNTPISYAIRAGASRVIVVTGNPLKGAEVSQLHGINLAGQIADISINERLFRDLRHAHRVNEKLARVEALLAELPLSDADRERLRERLGWKPLEIVEIRPEQALPGNAFSGLADAGLRAEYIEIGRARAAAVLGAR